jgi:hypothetical protein
LTEQPSREGRGLFRGLATLAFLLLSPILLFVTVVAAGGGHGVYSPAKILFPYTMAATAFTGGIVQPFIAAAIVQFPLYGVILDWTRSVGRFKPALLALAATHLSAVSLAFAVSNPSFTP